MRVPAPAAGMIPHTVPSSGIPGARFAVSARQNRLELRRAAIGGVLGERALARAPRDASQLLVRALDRDHGGAGRVGDENLFARLEELVESRPGVRQNRRAAGGG